MADDEQPRKHPELIRAQDILLTFIVEHPRMERLSIACGPFFTYMTRHDAVATDD